METLWCKYSCLNLKNAEYKLINNNFNYKSLLNCRMYLSNKWKLLAFFYKLYFFLLNKHAILSINSFFFLLIH